MSKSKIPLKIALKTAQSLVETLSPYCEKIEIAGSIRRKKAQVGDIEILYIPKGGSHTPPGELLEIHCEDLCEEKTKELIAQGQLQLRPKSDGTTAFGKRVKLLQTLPEKIPVDLFRCEPNEWFNNLVSRTGGKDNNILLASSALTLGLEWMPFGPGFRKKGTPEILPVTSEEDVYRICEVEFLPPEARL